jgi:hypothetical protein
MTDISASTSIRRDQSPAGIAGFVAIGLASGILLHSTSTALTVPTNVMQAEDTHASTSLNVVPYLQVVEASTPDTRLPALNEDFTWESRLAASFAAHHLVIAALDDLQTEDNLEHFQEGASEFIDHHGKAGIVALETLLLRDANPTKEPLARRFLRALGNQRSPAVDEAAKQLLLVQLDSVSGGRRSAAASALGAFSNASVLTALERRAAIEDNRIVRATLVAHIRVFRSNGASSSKTI